MQIDDIIKNVEIIDYNHKGLGITRVDNQVIFVKHALKGEILDIKVVGYKQKIYFAEIIKIIQKSENRVNPVCPHYLECGGCNLQHMNYQEQIKLKDNVFKNTLSKSKLELEVQELEKSTKELAYRNKITYSFIGKNTGLNLGLKKEQSNRIIKIDYCFLISKEMNRIQDEVLKLLRTLNLKSVSQSGNGLDQLVIRENNNKEFLLVLKVKNNKTKLLANSLEKLNKDIVGIYIEDKQGALITVREGDFVQQVGNLKYNVSPNSFFQVNNEQTFNIYNEVLRQIDNEDSTVLDAYCGSGTIGQYVNSKVKKIVGIEINKASIKDAKKNSFQNNIVNTEYIQGDLQKNIEKIYENNKDYFDVVIVDPPRKGISKNFMKILNEHLPKEIIYISCQPSTLTRDLKLLEANYKVKFIKQYDMFSQTYHVETIVKLEKNERN